MMKATKIEIRTAANRAGRTVHGVWLPGGQVVATLWLEQPGEALAREVAASITRLGGEEVSAEVIGRQEMPTDE